MIRLCLSMLTVYCTAAWAIQPVPQADSSQIAEVVSDTLDPVVVTAPRMQTPLQLHFDPRAPQQPLPAHDGASFLKTVPGMSVIRKGGTDGDPVFRGMAASRLNILLDGEQILGGCGFRMDPPTAYVSPEAYDRVTLLKGPQTVIYGSGNSAGTVLFERNTPRLSEPGYRFNISPMSGNFGRMDGIADLQAGTRNFYVRGITTNSRSGDYQDGEDRTVHSHYRRWSASGAAGWTPDDHTLLEFSTARSDGRAAYADRGVDGAKYAHENYGLKFHRKHVSPLVEKLEAQAYYNYIDHVMDDYTLRTFTPEGMGHEPSAMNPDRLTTGGRLALTLRPASRSKLIVGGDLQGNRHTNRSTMSISMGMGGGMSADTGAGMDSGTGMDTGSTRGAGSAYSPGQLTSPYQNLAREKDASFSQQGLFAEWAQYLRPADRVLGGLRVDRWQAEDHRQTLGMMGTPNPTAGQRRHAVLGSGFIRYERDLRPAVTTLYAGLGRSERFPDYWELISADKQGPDAMDLSAFATTDPEKTTQLDLGATFRAGRLSGFTSAFYSRISDYILIQANLSRGAGMMADGVTVVRNIDATTLGGETSFSYNLTPSLRLSPSLAYVRGENDTDHHPLAQLPPLESRLSLDWSQQAWSFGSLLRLVADQKRYALDEGNIVGQDLGPTSGFAVFSLNAGWKARPGTLIAVGIDNLFDQAYAEHLSKAGDLVPGFVQTARVEEPGRTLWIKGSFGITSQDSGPQY